MHWMSIAAILGLAVVSVQPVRGHEPIKATVPPAVNHDATAKKDVRQFVVRCQLVTDQGADNAKIISSPRIVVHEGQSATVSMQTETPFVTGIRKDREGLLDPIITNLKAGIELTVMVTPLDGKRVQVDAMVQHATIDKVEEVTIPAGDGENNTTTLQTLESVVHARRLVRTLSLGETVELRCGPSSTQADLTAQLTIDEINPNEAAITPLTATDPETEDDQKLYTVVYSVADLLEPYAVEKTDAELVDSDFIPIIDTLLRAPLTTWPAEAGIQAHPAKRAIAITQSQQGHEKIAKTLRDERDDVAEVHKLLRR